MSRVVFRGNLVLPAEVLPQGIVVVECVIDREGRVASARVLRSIPLLDAAALAAVQQWLYRPTLLNGERVAVQMTVTVRFHLR